jgi:purine-binding chemotaxis protein CheW
MDPSSKREDGWLLCRIGSGLCALPLGHVVEIMRPLPVEPVASPPAFVRGLSVIRGEPVPVIDLGLLLGGATGEPTRLVLIALGPRKIALAVEAVRGVRPADRARVKDLPPLLRDATGEAVAAIGTLDAELLLVLQSGRLVPESVLQRLVPEPAS